MLCSSPEPTGSAMNVRRSSERVSCSIDAPVSGRPLKRCGSTNAGPIEGSTK